eukprot:COSAG01_NODE_61871_length_287_cov_1.069149_1_plen_38_part_10
MYVCMYSVLSTQYRYMYSRGKTRIWQKAAGRQIMHAHT